jgi:hypothetical protein
MSKPMWKHVAILLATVVAFGFSLWMLQQVIGFASPWMALMLFFCFLGLAKVAEPIYMLKLPACVRKLRPWELHGDAYRRLGVPAFGALLRNTPLRLANTTVYVSRKRRDPVLICRQVESAEAIHFWGALALLPYLVLCLLTGKWNAFAGFLMVQVIGNAYPMMHLRSARGRLERLSRRRSGG